MPIIPLFHSGAADSGIAADDGSGNLLLRLGRLELSDFARLQPGDGADPYDTDGFVEPEFVDGPFAEGQPLVNLDSRNRQMTWPLYLNRTQKDLLHEFVAEINREIAQHKPLRIQWRDAGSTQSTFYDVAYARFDPSWTFHAARQKWLAGTLRVWCQPPYGHTATERIVAVGTSSKLLTLTLTPTQVNGDMGALMVARTQPYVGHTSIVTAQASGVNRNVAVSVVASGYQPEYLASAANTGVKIADNWAVASRIVRQASTAANPETYWHIPPGSQYHGRNRVLALVRNNQIAATSAVSAYAGVFGFAGASDLIGPTSMFTQVSSYFNLVDVGVWTYDATRTPATQTIVVAVTPAATGVGSTLITDWNGLLILPEDRTALTKIPALYADSATYRFDAVLDTVGIDIRETERRGQIPQLQPRAAEQVVVTRVPSKYFQPGDWGAEIRVRDRFTFAR